MAEGRLMNTPAMETMASVEIAMTMIEERFRASGNAEDREIKTE
jgi:hypothetical protein